MDLRKEIEETKARFEAEIKSKEAVHRTLAYLPKSVLDLIRFACKVERGTVRASIGQEHGGAYYSGSNAKPEDRARSLTEAFDIIDQALAGGWSILPVRSWTTNSTRYLEHLGGEHYAEADKSIASGCSEGYFWTEVNGSVDNARPSLHCVLAPPRSKVDGQYLEGVDRIRLTIALSLSETKFRLVSWKPFSFTGKPTEILSTSEVKVDGASGHRVASGAERNLSNIRYVIYDRAAFVAAIEGGKA